MVDQATLLTCEFVIDLGIGRKVTRFGHQCITTDTSGPGDVQSDCVTIHIDDRSTAVLGFQNAVMLDDFSKPCRSCRDAPIDLEFGRIEHDVGQVHHLGFERDRLAIAIDIDGKSFSGREGHQVIEDFLASLNGLAFDLDDDVPLEDPGSVSTAAYHDVFHQGALVGRGQLDAQERALLLDGSFLDADDSQSQGQRP